MRRSLGEQRRDNPQAPPPEHAHHPDPGRPPVEHVTARLSRRPGVRENAEWRDVIHIGGFSSGCYAWRERQSSLIVPGGSLVQTRTQGSALSVLNEVLTWPALPT